jgi:hypothetical protein
MEGAELLGTYPIGPVMAGSGLNMTFMSQLDSMNFSVQSCREKLPEAWDLADGINEWIDVLADTIEKPVPAKPATTARKKAGGKKKAGPRRKATARTPTPKKKPSASRKKAAAKR